MGGYIEDTAENEFDSINDYLDDTQSYKTNSTRKKFWKRFIKHLEKHVNKIGEE